MVPFLFLCGFARSIANSSRPWPWPLQRNLHPWSGGKIRENSDVSSQVCTFCAVMCHVCVHLEHLDGRTQKLRSGQPNCQSMLCAAPAVPPHDCWLTFEQSLRRWGKHCAQTPAPATIHHAPGRACRSRCCRHRLCLRGPTQLLQLLRQLHECCSSCQPHESC